MGLTNTGRDFIAGAIMGDESTVFDNSNAYLGVGDDSTAFAVTQTELAAETGSTSSLRKAMDSGYPSRDPDADGSDNKLRFRSTFGSAEGNFHWEEWGIFNDATAGTMLSRLVDDQGTKASGATWVFEVDIEVQIGS